MEFIKIDGVLWRDKYNPTPYCPLHRMELDAWALEGEPYAHDFQCKHLHCEEGDEIFKIPRPFGEERGYIKKKIESISLKDAKILNLDDEAILIVEAKAKPKHNKYFVTARLTKSKVGLRLVVYVGERGRKEKTQIFVEPDIKRLAFDQKDLHPTDIFTELQATFQDGTKTSFSKKKKSKK